MSHALALCPIIPNETPLSFAAVTPLRAFSRLAAPENVSNYETIRQQEVFSYLWRFIHEIGSLKFWARSWDGAGSEKPRLSSIDRAMEWGVKIYFLMLENDYEWRQPFVSADEEGDVVFEWWFQDRNLTLDISSDDATFFETRDADGSPEIISGVLCEKELPRKLKWLVLGD